MFPRIPFRKLLSFFFGLLLSVSTSAAGTDIEVIIGWGAGHGPGEARLRAFGLSGEGSATLLADRKVGRDAHIRLDVPDEGMLIEVVRDGFRPQLRWTTPATRGPIRIALTPQPPSEGTGGVRETTVGSSISGSVLDGQGKPIRGAKVKVSMFSFRSHTATPVMFKAADGSRQLELPADEDGKFTITIEERIVLPSTDAAGLLLDCSAPGFATMQLPIQAEAVQTVDCRLADSPTVISGRVVTSEGRVPESTVPLTLLASSHPPYIGTIRSSEDGSFASAESVPAAPQYFLLLNDPSFAPEVVPLDWSGRAEAFVPLRLGSDLRLQLVDASSGGAIAEADVSAAFQVNGFPLERQADAEETAGEYRVRNMRESEPAVVAVRAAGYLEARKEVFVDSSAPAEIVPLTPAGRITGTITDREGNRVHGAEVQALSDSKDGLGIDGRTYSDRTGRFTLGYLTRGATYEVAVHADGFAPWWKHEVRAMDGGALDVRLIRGAILEGRVIRENGEAVEGVVVTAIRVRPNRDLEGSFFADPIAQKQAKSDAEGRYRMEGIAEGSYKVELEIDSLPKIGIGFPRDAEAYRGAVGAPPIPLFDGMELTNHDFYLPSIGTVAVRNGAEWLKLENQPITVVFYERQTDEAFFGNRVSVSVEPGGGGIYEVADVGEGIYDVEVRVAGFAPARFERVRVVGGGRSEIELEDLVRGEELRIEAVDEAANPLAGVELELYRVDLNDIGPGQPRVNHIPDDNPSLVRARSDASGHAAFADLEPGMYQLHGSVPGRPYYYETFRLDRSLSGRGSDRTIVIGAGVTGRFRVENEGGLPIAGAVVDLTRIEQGFGGISIACETDARGECSIENLRPGGYQVKVVAYDAFAEGLVANRMNEYVVTVDGLRTQTLRLE